MNEKAPEKSSELTLSELADCLEAVAAARDVSAFRRLFDYYAPRVEAYLRRTGSMSAPAEDIAQDTLAAVWRRASQYDRRKATPSTWIFTIARNLRIDAYRRERRPEINPDDPALAREPEPPADRDMIVRQSAEELKRALMGLSPGEQEILRLAYFEDKSQSEIAAALDLPLGTVKSRIRLAFGKLRGRLGDTARGME